MLCLLFSALEPPVIDLDKTPVIQSSGRVVRKTYRPKNLTEDISKPIWQIKGNNLDLDFSGATLQGVDASALPDLRKGLAIQVTGSNITIRNLNVRGFKVGLIARNVNGLRIVNSDFSYNWKQHLLSGLDKEDGADWMSFHRNEKDEWLRYGAGIYLRGCRGFEVTGTKIEGGQCGLMLMESNAGKVWNNSFSFLSAIGLGMYESSGNKIMHNRIDWCVRGYSHGIYNRGQDSAGILIYEQSNHNLFAYNSVTHGGDGFFLWAGQKTMDTGKGGCNDNLLYGNDFSHAPTNGIEATFSRNNFINNLVMECWHGVWGGYSYNTNITGNIFAYNAESIALEHGQTNTISKNLFFREATAVNLWMNEKQDPNWGYGKTRDTKSHGYLIADNTFSQITQGGKDDKGTALQIRATSDVIVGPNRYNEVARILDLRGPMTKFVMPEVKVVNIDPSTGQASSISSATHAAQNIETLGTGFQASNQGNVTLGGLPEHLLPAVMRTSGNVILPYPDGISGYRNRFKTNWNPLKNKPNESINIGTLPEGKGLAKAMDNDRGYRPTPMQGGQSPFLSPSTARGRRYIIVDEWGPYDFKSPKLWLRDTFVDENAQSQVYKFEVLGPPGTWKVAQVSPGVKVSSGRGKVGDEILVSLPAGKMVNMNISLEYVGEETTDYRGLRTPKGRTVPFGFRKVELPIDWTVKFFKWGATSDPRTKIDAFRKLLEGTPLLTKKLPRLNYAGFSFEPQAGNSYWATLAEGVVTVPAGNYELETTTDDGMRVWIDGKIVIDDAWKYQGPTAYKRTLKLGGIHHIRVEHFQIDGYATLKVELKPIK